MKKALLLIGLAVLTASVMFAAGGQQSGSDEAELAAPPEPEGQKSVSRRVNIANGTLGTDARNAVAWRKAWVERLTECDQYVADYAKTTPLSSVLVYSTEFQQGDIDWDKETLPLTFEVCLVPDPDWPAPVTSVVDAAYEGLKGTEQAQTWKLEWPETSATGGASQVKPTVSVKYTLALELVNEEGAVLGRQSAEVSAGWAIGFGGGKAWTEKSLSPQKVAYPAVDIHKITDRMTLRVATINGRSAGTAGISVSAQALIGADYATILESGVFKD